MSLCLPPSRRFSPTRLLAVLGVSFSISSSFAGGEDIGTVLANAGSSAKAVLSTVRETDGLTFSDTPMGRDLAGVLAHIDGDAIDALRACQRDSISEDMVTSTPATAYLHLNVDEGITSFEIRALDDEHLILRDVDQKGTGPGRVFDRQCLEALYLDANLYRGPFTADVNSEIRGEDFELSKPYVPSPFTLDERTIRQRLLPTVRERLESHSENSVKGRQLAAFYEMYAAPTTRILNEETFQARLPKGYDARTPAGLFVWCRGWNATTTPPMFVDALDEHGFICVSASFTHNGRHATDRKQLMLDLVATARSRFHIDPRRVYVSGISGGGKVSSSLVFGFPEVFYGAVPIVGLASYNHVHGLTPLVEKPKGEQLTLARLRPIVNVTGALDFNYYDIKDRVHRLNLDRFDRVHCLEYDDMEHEMPTSERFAEALHLVDGVYQEIRDRERQEASAAFEAYVETHGENPPASREARDRLIEVMRLGPWTDAAWKASDLLH